MATTYAPGSAATFQAALTADASAVTVAVTDSTGDIVMAPTGLGIAHTGAGQYLYTWPIPADQAPGTLTLTWNATVSGLPEAAARDFTVSATGLPGTWCTVADVAIYAVAAVAQENVNAAQVMVEALIRRVWRATDPATRDYYWLRRAVAWQARYIAAHPEVLDMMDVASFSQDGIGITFKPGDSQMRVLYSPVALRNLNDLFRASNATIRYNSAFQKNRPPRGSVAAGSSVPWSNI